MNKETVIQTKIMLALSESGCIVWRNAASGAYAGRVIHKSARQVTLENATYMKFGLTVGASDIIGIAPDGRFLAVEVKTDTGRPTKEQLNFIAAVNRAGGIAGIARSVEDAINLIRSSNDTTSK